MNWTGGSRNRVSIKNIKRNFEDYCEVQRNRNLIEQAAEKYNINNANVDENKNISQDIAFLHTLMSKPPTPQGRQVTHIHLSTPKNKRGRQMLHVDLPPSPPSKTSKIQRKMSKLQMIFPDLPPSICLESSDSLSLEEYKEAKNRSNVSSNSAETQTEMKYFMDIGVQTEILHSEENQTDKDD